MPKYVLTVGRPALIDLSDVIVFFSYTPDSVGSFNDSFNEEHPDAYGIYCLHKKDWKEIATPVFLVSDHLHDLCGPSGFGEVPKRIMAILRDRLNARRLGVATDKDDQWLSAEQIFRELIIEILDPYAPPHELMSIYFYSNENEYYRYYRQIMPDYRQKCRVKPWHLLVSMLAFLVFVFWAIHHTEKAPHYPPSKPILIDNRILEKPHGGHNLDLAPAPPPMKPSH